ncbi:MAG TPA: geranylgeranyl reductase family protein [Burkholderiales bacterium]|nr:geranylgeranyl reductase family protein [Burkholderiales bacterium]
MTQSVDALVIGLGPAGACAAADAARRGCDVLAVDRRRRPGSPVQCAEFVPAMTGIEARRVFESARQPIRAMMTYIEHDAPDVKEDFPGYMLDRAAFDAALAADAAQAGAQCRFGTSARSVGRDGRVALSDGGVISAAVVIGADGPRSAAGRRIGQRNTLLVETRQVTVPLRARHEATDIFLSADIPGGYGWLFPKGDFAHVGAGVAPAHKARLKDIVAGLHAALVEGGRVGPGILARTGGAIPAGGMLKPWGMLGEALVLLAGDAAGLANPVTGAGIAAAVYSGKLAGQAAAAWLAGDREAGASHEDELRGVFQSALDRALARRRELAVLAGRSARPGRAALRRGWIAYPEYWAN